MSIPKMIILRHTGKELWHELVIVHAIISSLYIDSECVRAAFNFEAGHEYKIKSRFLSHFVEVIDVNTGVTIFSHTLEPCNPRMCLNRQGKNYGSWVSARLLYVPRAISILLAGLSFLLPVLAVFAVIL
jgi:hypothetical protein